MEGYRLINQESDKQSKIKGVFRSSKKIFLLIIVLIVVAFLVSIPIYNSAHNPQKQITNILTAIKGQDSTKISGLIIDQNGAPLTSNAATALVLHYIKHLDQFENNIGVLGTLPAGSSVAQLEKHSTAGYTSFTIKVLTDKVLVSALKGTYFQVGDSIDVVQSTGDPAQELGSFMKGIPVTVAATYKTDWGNVTQSKDVIPGSGSIIFDFNDYYYKIDTSFTGKGNPILVNGKDSGKVTSGETDPVLIGPLPSNQEYIFSLKSKEPYGDFAFSASSKDKKNGNTLIMSSDIKANISIINTVSQTIDKFNTLRIMNGDYKSLLFPETAEMQGFAVSRPADSYSKLVLMSSSLLPTSLKDTNHHQGVYVTVLETYDTKVYIRDFLNSYRKTYFLIWDDTKQWKIYNEYDNGEDSSYKPSDTDIVINH